IKLDALMSINLCLAIKRTVIGIFADQHMRDEAFSRDAAFNQAGWRWSLDDRFLAGPAGIFRTARHNHLELSWNDIQPLGSILSHHMHGRTTAWAGFVLRFDDDLFPR